MNYIPRPLVRSEKRSHFASSRSPTLSLRGSILVVRAEIIRPLRQRSTLGRLMRQTPVSFDVSAVLIGGIAGNPRPVIRTGRAASQGRKAEEDLCRYTMGRLLETTSAALFPVLFLQGTREDCIQKRGALSLASATGCTAVGLCGIFSVSAPKIKTAGGGFSCWATSGSGHCALSSA
jgi:hypothetical protein